MGRHAWVLLAIVLLAGCATVPAASDSDVRAASDLFFAVRNRGDAAAFAAQFTEDGSFGVPGLPDATGRAAVQALAEKRFAGARVTDFNIVRREIGLSGNTAHELGWFAETDRRGDSAMRMQGRYLLVWNRGADSVWRVHRYFYAFSGAEPVP
jgi:uncharacterized protein (TIGR02246 family)